jgi:membrane-bound metal-dependent hydrolase YbcI (DUF457 family)
VPKNRNLPAAIVYWVSRIVDLPTHAFFGFAIGLIFFGHPEIAFLVGLGSLVPDLDREYWFVKSSVYRDEQLHRALLHNVFVIGLLYLLSPFLALGVFLHMLLDSFTTSKDRGCEWFWPLSRLVKRGLYDSNMEPQPIDPNERIYFYQEDVNAVIEYAEPNLPEPESPWRRVYGPALNSNLLDRGFLSGSIILTVVWLLTQYYSNPALLSNSITKYIPHIVAYGSVIALFLGGELDRRDQEAPFGKKQLDPLQNISFLKIPLVAVGGVLAAIWPVLYRNEIMTNLKAIGGYWISILVAGILVVILNFLIIKWQTRKGKPLAIV